MQANAYPDVITKDTSIEKLQDCFRGELAAVETYQLALDTKGTAHVGLHHALQEMLTSHARRSELLLDKIQRWGGEPPTTSGVWGTFAKAIQAGADLLGYRMAVAALEEGEDRGVRIYTESLEGCDPTTRELIETELLPEQQRTRDLCRTLHEYLDAPS
jgi:demethoxyubiquinone hydroxylase (CLK1/Coq7/Cat5 family)